jgi:pimeloyl-ACP methyl ester carboxylesterase
MREVDVFTDDGRVLHAYDVGPTGRLDELVVLWHHGTPNIGAPPEPLFKPARTLGIRWIAYDRPGYGGSTPHRNATIASAATDAGQVADQLGIERFAAFGHSGGGARALDCGALLPDRVRAVVSVSSPAPWPVDGLDYFAGMSDGPARELRVDGMVEDDVAAMTPWGFDLIKITARR